jgi:NAD(P)-dependent dehydrogenase (short-subunit alcohol dehydrogenase family)
LLTARWLIEKGAGAIVLLNRNAPQGDALRTIDELAATGTKVLAIQGDVTSEEDIQRALETISRELPPLRGVFHAAGLLDNGALLSLTLPQFENVMAPKAVGAWLLHSATRGLPLDYFVLYSSIASLFGAAGQANHAAANTFMDRLAHHRATQGLPALSINWGAWGEAGAVIAYEAQEHLANQGIGLMSSVDALAALDYLLTQTVSQVGVSAMNWRKFLSHYRELPLYFSAMLAHQSHTNEVNSLPKPTTQPATDAASLAAQLAEATPTRRQLMLTTFILEQAAHVLGLPQDNLGEELPLSDYGLDSLMAVELRNLIGRGLEVKRSLPATLVFDYPTIGEISHYLLHNVLDLGAQTETTADQPLVVQVGSGTSLDTLSAMENLSDDDVDRLFAQLGISDDDQ